MQSFTDNVPVFWSFPDVKVIIILIRQNVIIKRDTELRGHKLCRFSQDCQSHIETKLGRVISRYRNHMLTESLYLL